MVLQLQGCKVQLFFILMPHFIVYASSAIAGIYFPNPKEDKKCLCSLIASILVGEKGHRLIKGKIQG